MFQYSAAAGKIPLTLKHDQISDGFLIGQDDLNIEFRTFDEVIKEMDHLITDDVYLKERERTIKNALISSQAFDKEVNNLLANGNPRFPIVYTDIDTSEFRKIYAERDTNKIVNEAIAKRNTPMALLSFPLRYIQGAIMKEKRKVENRFKK